MGIYERTLVDDNLESIVKDFMEHHDFKKAIQKIKNDYKIEVLKLIEYKGFEVITKIDSEKEKGEIHEFTVYLRYEDNILIRVTELKVKNENVSLDSKDIFSVNIEIRNIESNKQVVGKFSIENGNITFEDKIEVENIVENVNNSMIPTYLEVPHDVDEPAPKSSPVPCFNWDGTGTCCKFRYNGLPWKPLVTYKWCGANCGNGCGSTPKPVNPLDNCCKSHDCCYVKKSSYPSRCSCDKSLINCARKTDNAGSDRVVVAFQAKMLYYGC